MKKSLLVLTTSAMFMASSASALFAPYDMENKAWQRIDTEHMETGFSYHNLTDGTRVISWVASNPNNNGYMGIYRIQTAPESVCPKRTDINPKNIFINYVNGHPVRMVSYCMDVGFLATTPASSEGLNYVKEKFTTSNEVNWNGVGYSGMDFTEHMETITTLRDLAI